MVSVICLWLPCHVQFDEYCVLAWVTTNHCVSLMSLNVYTICAISELKSDNNFDNFDGFDDVTSSASIVSIALAWLWPTRDFVLTRRLAFKRANLYDYSCLCSSLLFSNCLFQRRTIGRNCILSMRWMFHSLHPLTRSLTLLIHLLVPPYSILTTTHSLQSRWESIQPVPLVHRAATDQIRHIAARIIIFAPLTARFTSSHQSVTSQGGQLTTYYTTQSQMSGVNRLHHHAQRALYTVCSGQKSPNLNGGNVSIFSFLFPLLFDKMIFCSKRLASLSGLNLKLRSVRYH